MVSKSYVYTVLTVYRVQKGYLWKWAKEDRYKCAKNSDIASAQLTGFCFHSADWVQPSLDYAPAIKYSCNADPMKKKSFVLKVKIKGVWMDICIGRQWLFCGIPPHQHFTSRMFYYYIIRTKI